MVQSVLYNPFRSGRNRRKISYRHANRYESPLCSTSAKISACSGLFRPVSAGNPVSAGLLFKPLPTVSVTSSRLQQSSPVHLRLFFFFFFFFLLPSSSFFRPALSVSDSLYLFFTFFFLFFGSSAVIAVKPEMKKKNRQKKWIEYSGREVLKPEKKK